MGQHRQNPTALAAAAARRPIPTGSQIGAQITIDFEKKPTVLVVKHEHYREVEGRREYFIRFGADEPTWQAQPEGITIKLEGETIGMDECDCVIRLVTAAQHGGGIVSAHGQTPVTVIPLMELARVDAKQIIEAHENVLKGGMARQAAEGS